MRRAQIVLWSASGQPPRAIAAGLGCARQTVGDAIGTCDARGQLAPTAGSARPKSAAPVLDRAELERLRAILPRSPRAFGQARSSWTLALLARVAHQQGPSAGVLSAETIRRALLRPEVGWKRAKRWLTSPDPACARQKGAATAGSTWPRTGRAGCAALPTRSGSRVWRNRPCMPGRRARRCALACTPPLRPIPPPRRWPATACGCRHGSGGGRASSGGGRSAR
ncbi:hypothetical protein [Benzoatithermus flavus]|uniref:Transposase n=1 Tax=Benzoatithermus flavus TaxID=3108223 RepID=A0ABU8XQQ5_9PROT